MKEFKPFDKSSEIEPVSIDWKEYLFEKQKRKDEILTKIEEAIKEYVYGTVRAYHVYNGTAIKIEVYNDKFDYEYFFEARQLDYIDINMLVYDFICAYRIEVIKRYFKGTYCC